MTSGSSVLGWVGLWGMVVGLSMMLVLYVRKPEQAANARSKFGAAVGAGLLVGWGLFVGDALANGQTWRAVIAGVGLALVCLLIVAVRRGRPV